MRRLFLYLCLVCLWLIPVTAQDETTATPAPTVPNLIGLTAAQAEAALNAAGMRLDPFIISVDTGTGNFNTIIDQSPATGETVNQGASISITVRHEYNLELRWQTPEHNNNLFNVRNLSETNIAFGGVRFKASTADNFVDTSAFPDTLRTQQCIQSWTFTPGNNDFEQLAGCRFVQDNGIIGLPDVSDQFWIHASAFDIYQDGVYRATCQQSAGQCQVWVSPSSIAEDIAPYVYLIYDAQQLVVYNNSDSQWMDLAHLFIDGSDVSLSETRNWDRLIIPDIDRLAPNQCVRFTRDVTIQPLDNCDEIAFVVTNNAFWQNIFLVTDLLAGEDVKRCPSLSGERTICLLQR